MSDRQVERLVRSIADEGLLASARFSIAIRGDPRDAHDNVDRLVQVEHSAVFVQDRHRGYTLLREHMNDVEYRCAEVGGRNGVIGIRGGRVGLVDVCPDTELAHALGEVLRDVSALM